MSWPLQVGSLVALGRVTHPLLALFLPGQLLISILSLKDPFKKLLLHILMQPAVLKAQSSGYYSSILSIIYSSLFFLPSLLSSFPSSFPFLFFSSFCYSRAILFSPITLVSSKNVMYGNFSLPEVFLTLRFYLILWSLLNQVLLYFTRFYIGIQFEKCPLRIFGQ